MGTKIVLNGSDSDSKHVSFILTELPTKGRLYKTTGEPINYPYSPFQVRRRPRQARSKRQLKGSRAELFRYRFLVQARVSLPAMYASAVKNVSSFWPAGPHAQETLCPPIMPTNSTAEQLGCGYPQWHPFQICGKASTSSYGDSSYAWCPASRLGNTGYATDGDQYIRFAWDPSLSFAKDGFTEFIEVEFPTSVYVQSIEIGEPRGMGSIVRIKAFDAASGDYSTLWESPTSEGDVIVQYLFQKRSEYRVFTPFPLCQTTFKSDTIRIEMDTRTVQDWNEIDYVQLTGSLNLPDGVLEGGSNELVYVPNADAFGDDAFSYSVSDCAFYAKRASAPATVSTRIFPVNDPPRARDLAISDISPYLGKTGYGSSVASIDLLDLCSDVDNDSLVFTIEQEAGSDTDAWIEGHMVLLRWAKPQDAAQQGFGLWYIAEDPSRTTARGSITFWPGCSNGIVNGTRCIPCPPGTYAKDEFGHAECRPCDPGQFQPETGQYSCINCDRLGNFYQDRAGQTSCQHCEDNTQRYIGVLSAANKTACQCMAGAPSSLGVLTLQSVWFCRLRWHPIAFAGYYNPKLEAGEVRHSATPQTSPSSR